MCSGQMTTSPSSRGPTAAPSSSIGKESTSVGPSLPRYSALSSAIRSGDDERDRDVAVVDPRRGDASRRRSPRQRAAGGQRVAEHLDLEHGRGFAVRRRWSRAQLGRGALGVAS